MIKHGTLLRVRLIVGRAGVPIEVMGMMLGEFADDLTIYVTDVFPMPQLGTAASVETLDEKYQSELHGTHEADRKVRSILLESFSNG